MTLAEIMALYNTMPAEEQAKALELTEQAPEESKNIVFALCVLYSTMTQEEQAFCMAYMERTAKEA